MTFNKVNKYKVLYQTLSFLSSFGRVFAGLEDLSHWSRVSVLSPPSSRNVRSQLSTLVQEGDLTGSN